ncbi:PRA1 family protein [Popillia japonica]|uniref:PRA1 family protein n=1 Tax=Popillia japonica TaxID=7064 RepID=A0AAW1NIU0_POPJA
MAQTKDNNVEIAPLRSLDDFLLESARFQIPDIKHPEKWGNRVVKNLLYYQTNYFLLYIFLFVIVGVIHPREVASGAITTGLIILLYFGFTNNTSQIEYIRSEYRNVSIVGTVLALYFVYYMLNNILVLLVALLFPVSVIFIHASLRLRNFKNKLANQVEMLEIKVTPMGLILRHLGLQTDISKIATNKKLTEISENLKL